MFSRARLRHADLQPRPQILIRPGELSFENVLNLDYPVDERMQCGRVLTQIFVAKSWDYIELEIRDIFEATPYPVRSIRQVDYHLSVQVMKLDTK